jgi:hypothetical protein
MPVREPAPQDLLSLSRAARLIGVSRERLRARLLARGIPFDSLIAWGDVRALFPGPLPVITARRHPSQEALDQLDRLIKNMQRLA